MSVAKNMSKEKLLRCSWTDIVPGDAHLTAMPLLKELINMASLPISYRSLDTLHKVLQQTFDVRAQKSPEVSEVATTILFQQPTNIDQSVKIFWVNSDGERVVDNELVGVGAECEHPTSVGHVWVLTSGQRDDSIPKKPLCPYNHGNALLNKNSPFVIEEAN
jgi:hypothetical protein